MSQQFRCNLSSHKCRFYRLLFCLVWISGLLIGCLISIRAGYISSLMRGIFRDSVSIVSLLSVSYLPFLLSAFAVSIGLPWLLYPICFVKAICFACVSLAVFFGFGSAGWLVRLLLMFSDVSSLPLLVMYSMRHIPGIRRFSLAEFFLEISTLTLIGSIDYCFVSPFLATL